MNIIFMCVFVALTFSSLVFAEEIPFSGFQVNWDNDLWAKGHTDRWYTNGIRFSWSLREPPDNVLVDGYKNFGGWFLWDYSSPSITYSVGQVMYTPRNILVKHPQIYDRPWAAFLFGSVAAHAYGKGRDSNEFRVTELKVGMVGAKAFGEDVQSFVHRVVRSNQPKGWDNQVDERVGIQLSHARVYGLRDVFGGEYGGVQFGFGGAVGTLRTHANVSGAFVFGKLKGSASPILVGNEGDFVVQDFSNREQFERPYGFIAISRSRVFSNYFIEGDTSYGKSSIQKRTGYTVFQWGFSIPLQSWCESKVLPRIMYTNSTRSPEFSSPRVGKKEGWQRWGTLTANWDFE